ncbi:MAG: NAD(P)/FAD-dependent oxidoreductase [Acidimicrobiia bacterium]
MGAGPNGLAAAVEFARSGSSVLLVEGADEIGGGTRTAELTLPGFRHDVCSAIHPSGIASPFFNQIGLDVDWVQPPIPFAHPLDGGRSVALHRGVEDTASQLGSDGDRYESLMGPLVERIDAVVEDVLSPMTIVPKHLRSFTRVAAIGGLPASMLARLFSTEEAKALLAGMSAHSIAPFTSMATSGVGFMLGAIGHAHGWPLARGGSQAIAEALADQLTSLGGVIETGRMIDTIDDLPAERVLLDVMPPAAYRMARHRLSASSRRRLLAWKPGPGIFKVDWALDSPIPWADELSGQAGTVHLGGSFSEVEQAERAVFEGRHPERPFVLLAQQSLFDDTRAPAGKHTAWAYCHVPNGSSVDMTEAIESQVERFAPGFREVVLDRATRGSSGFEGYNPNYVGGDIGGGEFGLKKVLQMGSTRPFDFGNDVYLCSSATPPGAGVHGMCGYYAARAALS